MVSVTYTTFNTLYGLSVGQTQAEAIIDQAIDLLNLYANQSISNLSGGSTTVTGAQRGAIMMVAWAIYYSLNPTGAALGPVSATPANPMMNAEVMKAVNQAANMLTTRKFEKG